MGLNRFKKEHAGIPRFLRFDFGVYNSILFYAVFAFRVFFSNVNRGVPVLCKLRTSAFLRM